MYGKSTDMLVMQINALVEVWGRVGAQMVGHLIGALLQYYKTAPRRFDGDEMWKGPGTQVFLLSKECRS